MREGIRASQQRGRWITQASTGYLNRARQKDGPSLIVDPVRRPLVRQPFEAVAAGESMGCWCAGWRRSVLRCSTRGNNVEAGARGTPERADTDYRCITGRSMAGAMGSVSTRSVVGRPAAWNRRYLPYLRSARAFSRGRVEWCALLDSNQGPPPCEGDALPLSQARTLHVDVACSVAVGWRLRNIDSSGIFLGRQAFRWCARRGGLGAV